MITHREQPDQHTRRRDQDERHSIHSSELAAHELRYPIVDDTKGKRPQQRCQQQCGAKREQAET
jgi:hypothetical protein